MNPTDRHYCAANRCELAAIACASRYDRVINRPKETLWSQIYDSNCERCRIGKRMLKTFGPTALNEYRSGVNGVRRAAFKRMERKGKQDGTS